MSQNYKPYSGKRWREWSDKGTIYDYSQVTEENRKHTELAIKKLREIRKKKSSEEFFGIDSDTEDKTDKEPNEREQP